MQRRIAAPIRRAKAGLCWSTLVFCAVLCAWSLQARADQPAHRGESSADTAPHATARRAAHARKRSAAKPAEQVAAAPPAPAAPPPPNWPVNDKPVDATVVWDSHGLRIDAHNSSLGQILKDVATNTGTKVEGLGNADVRVFGTYGPGPANEVISQLLNGTGYNVLMIGDQGAGAPRQIVLSVAPTGPAPQNNARNSSEEDYEAEQPPQEPPVMNGGFAPPQPRNAQQMEEMQLRQEQMQQQLRNQMLNQQMPPDAAAPQR